jgi:hypothetical protein
MTSEYTARIPDIMMGISDCCAVRIYSKATKGAKYPTFITRSGRKVPTPAMPIPDLAVP